MSSKLRGGAARGAAAADLACMFMGSTLVTPLYVLYEEEFGFSELTLTLIFSAYALGNIASLFILGRLSDQIGRRRTALPAIGVAAVATLVFLFAAATAWLFVGARAERARDRHGFGARRRRGWSTSRAIARRSAARRSRPAAIFFGLAIAALLGGVLAQYAPAPLKLPFVVYLSLLAILAFFVARTKETVEDRAESVDEVSLEPRIGIPREIRGALRVAGGDGVRGVRRDRVLCRARAEPAQARHGRDQSRGSPARSCSRCSSAPQSPRSRRARCKSRTAMLSGAALLIPGVVLLVAAQTLQSLPILVAGAVVTGIAAALGYRGSLQVINEIAPKAQRAEVISSFAIVCFIGNGVPVIGVGVLSRRSTRRAVATVSLAAVTTVLALVALVTELVRNRKREAGAPA